MLPALLSIFKKRSYADYKHDRDPDIWPSRVELLDYEEAMELEMLLNEMIDAKPEELPREGTSRMKSGVTPATPGLRQTPRKTPMMKTPLKTPMKAAINTPMKTPKGGTPPNEWLGDYDHDDMDEEELPPDPPQVLKYKRIVHYLDEWILHRWRVQVEFKRERNAARTPALQRFEPGKVQST